MAQIIPRFQAFDDSGDPLSGGLLYTLIAGGPTNKATYSDPGLTTPNANPVILDGRGEAPIFGSGTYKLILKTSAGVTVWTQDDVEVASASVIVDADGDTKVQVEESPDEDIIRFDIAGTEKLQLNSTSLNVDVINEITSAAGVTIDGSLIKDGDIKVDTITEKTGAAGVTIDSLLIKDGKPMNGLPGLHIRPVFAWKDADENYLDPALIDHKGTSHQLVYWDSQLTFQFGSAGSNAASDNLAANKWFHLFIDDSAVVTLGTNLLTAAEFIAKNEDNVTVSWNAAKHGYYETTATSDKCIGSFLTDGSSNIVEFFHEDDLLMFADQINDLSVTDIDNVWTDVTLTRPEYCTKVLATFLAEPNGGAETSAYWRTNDQAGATAHLIGLSGPGNARSANTSPVVTDSAGIIEVVYGISDANLLTVYTDGYYFPIGM